MKKLPISSAVTDDQDSAWKDLLDEYLADCLAFFFPDVAREIDWTKRWQSKDKELARLQPELPSGKLYADKLYQVWLKNGKTKWLLIHLEVQGRAHRGFARRVFDYSYRISAKHPGRDVVSLVIVTETKRPVAGRYERRSLGCSLVFTFPLVQLSFYADQLDELEKNLNPFALAVAVQLKALETRGDNQSRFEWKLAYVKRLVRRGYTRAQITALLRFMDFAMQLPATLEDKIQETIHELEEGKKMPFLMYAERKAKAAGIQEGEQRGERKTSLSLVTELLTERFGKLGDTLQTKLRRLSAEQLHSLFTAALKFESKEELTAWLKQHGTGAMSRRNGLHGKAAAH